MDNTFHLEDRVIIYDENNHPVSADNILGMDSTGILLSRSNVSWNLDGTEKVSVSKPKHFEKVVFTNQFDLYRELIRKYILKYDYDAMKLQDLEQLYEAMRYENFR